MRKFILLSTTLLVLILGCTKEEDLNGNNVTYEATNFVLEERITLSIPNTVLGFIPGSACLPISPLSIPYEQMVPASNPNPYAHLVQNITPRNIKMELLNVEGCDFSMLDNVDIYMVDKDVADIASIVFFDEMNPTAYYNAKKMASMTSIADGVGSVLYPDIDPDIVLDEFIHDQDFQIFMVMDIDKTFTSAEALIKTTLELDVTLINNN